MEGQDLFDIRSVGGETEEKKPEEVRGVVGGDEGNRSQEIDKEWKGALVERVPLPPTTFPTHKRPARHHFHGLLIPLLLCWRFRTTFPPTPIPSKPLAHKVAVSDLRKLGSIENSRFSRNSMLREQNLEETRSNGEEEEVNKAAPGPGQGERERVQMPGGSR